MSKTRAKWSENVYKKKLKEGRGQGELAAYKPLDNDSRPRFQRIFDQDLQPENRKDPSPSFS